MSSKHPERKKNAVRKLTDNDNLHDIFDGSKEETQEDFKSLLEESFMDDRVVPEEETPEKPPSRELTRNYPPPQAKLDLHGKTSTEAATETARFIRDAFSRRLRTVRIVTGKGIHSKGRAVLPDIVEKTLASLKKNGFVLTFTWEKRSKLSSGSVIVYLPEN